MPTPSTGRRTPYHLLEVKVAKMQEQLESITSAPRPLSTSLKTDNSLAFEADKKSLSKSLISA
jgi:hypothetical protein